ncbi:MAG: helix-turn-helix domain-containing protein [bacterium]|nr:helix-turn-helix domain-containing protein [bacterium]
MQIVEALQNIGLNEKEAKVYTALLSLGESTAYVIADRAGLKKPTTYVILEQLIKKGAARLIPRAKKARYAAIPPEELLAMSEERLQFTKKILPELLALAEGKTQKSKTLFFDNLPAVKKAFLNQAKIMAGKEMIGFYAHAGEASKDLLSFFDEYNDELKKRKVSLRGIAPDSPDLKHFRDSDAEYDRTMKIVPFEEYSAPISMDIGEKHVMFFEFKNTQATLIESERIANTMRQIFEMLWKQLS